MNQITKNRSKVTASIAVVIVLFALVLPASASSLLEPPPNPFLPQCDPGWEEYVLDRFTLGENSMEVLVTKTANGRFAAVKEYWSVNRAMLMALARATTGATMKLSGSTRRWPAPTGFEPTFRMQDPVTWTAAPGPTGSVWVFHDAATDTYVCIQFNLAGATNNPSVRSISWHLSARTPPGDGTYVFKPGTTYSLTYAARPELPRGHSWYAVTVQPGS